MDPDLHKSIRNGIAACACVLFFYLFLALADLAAGVTQTAVQWSFFVLGVAFFASGSFLFVFVISLVYFYFRN